MILSRIILIIFASFTVILLPKVTFAQSCGDDYYRQTVNKSQCPSNKGCSNGCINSTGTDTVSCFWGGGACIGNIQPGPEYCQFGACTAGTRSCSVQINALGLMPVCSACPYGPWTDQSCGGGSCSSTEMQQTQSSSTATSVCQTKYRCVSSSSCAAPTDPKPTATPVPQNCSGTLCDGSSVVASPGQVVCGSPDAGGTCRTSQCNGSTGGWIYIGAACSATPTPPPGSTPTPTPPPGSTPTPVGPVPPVPPTNLIGSCNGTNTVNLSWTPGASDTYYELRVNNTTTGGWDGTCSGGGDFCATQGSPAYSFIGALNNTYSWWVHSCNSLGCTSPGTVGNTFTCLGGSTPTPTPTVAAPTPTTPAVPGALYKLRDASFYKLGNLSSTITPLSTIYDFSDTSPTIFNQGASGIVAAIGSINVGTGTVSSSGWSRANTTIPSTFTASSFKSYVMTNKSVTTVTDLSQILVSGLYYYNGDLTISSDIAPSNVVLIVNGNVTLRGTGGFTKSFNIFDRPFALVVAGTSTTPKTLTFGDSLTQANGLFIADTIAFSELSSSTTPLKITGNVTSSTPVAMTRNRGTSAPSLFIVFNPVSYVNLIDKLSVLRSSWTQIQ